MEQGVAAEHRAQVRRVPAHRSRRVARRVQRAHLHAADVEHQAVVDAAEVLVRMRHSPQHVVGGMQQHRRVERLAEFRCDGDVVVVAVRADHRDDVAARDRLDDGLGVVRGVEHDDVGVVADQPDVVVDFPAAAVEFERAVGDHALDGAAVHRITTERRTSPACILWKASSMPSSPMRSETNFSSGSRPCR